MHRGIAWLLAVLLVALPARAQDARTLPAKAPGTIRAVVWNTGLFRRGAGLLLRDIQARRPAVMAVVETLRALDPDILLMTVFDRDPEGRALSAFARLLATPGSAGGLDLPHRYQGASNTGRPSGRDLDGDGRLHEPEDAWGYGAFPGQYAMALLSRLPFAPDEIRSYRRLAWHKLPGAMRPERVGGGGAFHPDPVWQAMRLSSKSHWEIPIHLPDGGRLRILAAHPTPPVFDGPGSRNADRNGDEIRLLAAMIEAAPWLRDDRGRPPAPEVEPAPVLVMGTLNADPDRGAAHPGPIRALLAHRRLQDPRPVSPGAPSGATVAWPRDDGPAQRQRVDYLLPDARLRVIAAGVHWPAGPARDRSAPANRPVWTDFRLE